MPDKQQIVFVSRVLWAGGAERVVYDLAHHLDKERFEVHIVCLFEQHDVPISFDPQISIHFLEQVPPEPHAQRLGNALTFRKRLYYRSKEIYQHLVPASIRENLKLQEKLFWFADSDSSSNPPKFLLPTGTESSQLSLMLRSIQTMMPSIMALQQALTKFRRDAILLPVMEEATVRVWLTQLFQHRPYIASLHSVESYNMGLIYPDPLVKSMEEWMFANACRAAEIVTVPSNGCGQDLNSNYGVALQHIKVIPNPVDTDSVLQQSRLPVQSRFEGKKTSFVYVGRLDLDKNPELLLEAAYLLKKRYSDFSISFIGKGALYSKLSLQIEEMGLRDNVALLGEVPNPFPHMKRSRALVLTSRVESFALVLVEAMLCGTVPIAVDCPYGPREILENGRYGILVPPNDAEALSEAMWQIAHDDELYSNLRKLGSEHALRYSVSGITNHWEDLLSKISDRQDLMGQREPS